MSRVVTSESFIKKAKKIHKDIYGYYLIEYVNAKTKVTIICKEHGVFKITPDAHLRGQGCNKCRNIKTASKNKLNTKQLIERAQKVHGDQYNYNDVFYKDSKSKISIICKSHGKFEQSPDKHLQGNGCLKCKSEKTSSRMQENNPGWSYSNWKKAAENSKNFDSFKVYVIRCWNDDEEFYKIGKTFKTIKKRFDHIKTLPYNYEIVKKITGNHIEVSELEKELHKKHKKDSYTPKLFFQGRTECYSKFT